MRAVLLTTVMTMSAGLMAAQQTPRIITTNSGSYIGVGLQEIDSERAKALKLREEMGVEITSVAPDSPAEKAGLKPGDAVLQYNGQRVDGIEQFRRMISETPIGREVKMEVFRGGAVQTVIVKVGTRRGTLTSNSFPMSAGAMTMTPIQIEPMEIRIPDIPRALMSWRSSMLGVDVEGIDGQLAQYFGVKEGVLVRSVSPGSAAEKAGIKAGDVIVKVEDSSVTNPADLSNRLRSFRGKSAPMVVMREHREMSLSLPVTEDLRNEWFFQQDGAAPLRPTRPMRIE
jgi:serine protease Do